MSTKKIRLILILLFSGILLSSCLSGEDSGSATVGSDRFESDANGGGFPGKADFDFFTLEPICPEETADPNTTIEIDFDGDTASVNVGQCDTTSTTPIDISDVTINSYNPYMAFYDNKVWGEQSLHAEYSNHLYYREFCQDSSAQIDFTMQYIYSGDDIAGGVTQWIGVLYFGAATGNPGIQWSAGAFTRQANGDIFFRANSFSYQIQISGTNTTSSTAVLTFANGTTHNMTCFILEEE